MHEIMPFYFQGKFTLSVEQRQFRIFTDRLFFLPRTVFFVCLLGMALKTPPAFAMPYLKILITVIIPCAV